jgi:hypothetical protein
VALAPRVAALQLLGNDDRPWMLLELLQRFAAGESIAATDPAIEAHHQAAIDPRNRAALTTASAIAPAIKPTGTLPALLGAIGWELKRDGRIKARGDDLDALTYRAQRIGLPEGVDPQALAAAWQVQLRSPEAGALSIQGMIKAMGKKCPSYPPPWPSPPPRPWPLARSVAIPW